MRLVDVFKENLKADKHYHFIQQPMTIYHTVEEFLTTERCESLDAFKAVNGNKLITDYNEFIAFMQSVVRSGYNEYDLKEYNCWFKTKDEFIPDSYDYNGKIVYKTDDNGDMIPTDGCYVRVYCIIFSYNRFVLVTSSGLGNIFFTKWDLSAAVRSQYNHTGETLTGKDRDAKYEAFKRRMFTRTKPTAAHVRLVHSLFNPLSDLFLDLPKAMKMAFPKIKTGDRNDLLQTKAFRSAIMELIRSLQPDLKKTLVEAMPPAEVAAWMKDMISSAITGTNFKDKKEALMFIIDTAYTENVAVNNNMQVPLLPMQNQPYVLPSEPIVIDGSTEEVDLTKLKDELDYPDGAMNDGMDDEFDPTKVTLE